MGEGAIGGAIGSGIALAAAAVFGGGAQVAKDLGVLPKQGGYPSIGAAIAACMTAIVDPADPAKVLTMDLEDLAEFANAWLADEGDERLETISLAKWRQYLQDVRKQAKAVHWYETLGAPGDFDTSLGNTSLANNQTLYYIEALGKISRGYEINYVGQGMIYNRLPTWMKCDCYVSPYTWKPAMMAVEKVTGIRLGSRPYDWPTRDEIFFCHYGFANYNQD